MNRIRHFPISFFSVILGLGGFTISLQKTEELLNTTYLPSIYILYTTTLLFCIIMIFYLLKYLYFKKEVRKEFNSPIKLSFFPAISISLLLLSIAYIPILEQVSKHLWEIGTVVHLFFTFKITSIWIQHKNIEIKHINPAWFIPAVGNIIVPIGGVLYYPHEISWFFFSIGLMLWTILQTIIFYRIIFHNPLPNKLLPTLFILIAPPAVGFISYVKLTGNIDTFAHILYYFALFMTLLLLFQTSFFRRIKFFLSWWAYSFPISAFTIASILMYRQTNTVFFKYLSITLFILLTSIVTYLVVKTIVFIQRKEICIPEEE